jgi:hypothetical protein
MGGADALFVAICRGRHADIRINILALCARLPTLQGVRENVGPGSLVLWTKLHGVAAVVGAPVLGVLAIVFGHDDERDRWGA